MAAAKPIRSMTHDRLQLFTGTPIPALATEIASHLDMEVGNCMVKQFAMREIYLQIQENVRGGDVFVIQPTCTPVERNLMELLLMLDALKRASAERITAVFPIMDTPPDRKDKPGFRSPPGWFGRAGNGGGRPGSDAGLTRGADSGLFRYPGGSSVRVAGDDRVFKAQTSRAGRWYRRMPGAWSGPGVRQTV